MKYKASSIFTFIQSNLVNTLICLLIFCGCSTMKPVSMNKSDLENIKQDEFVRLRFNDGKYFEGYFQSRTADSIRLNTKTFPIDSIEYIERMEIDKSKTTGAVIGTSIAAYAVYGLLAYLFFIAMLFSELS